MLRQARFGFQGSYGSRFDFALLSDAAASTTGSVMRDVYLNVRFKPGVAIPGWPVQGSFAQETGIGDTSLDFVERGFQSVLTLRRHRRTAVPGSRCMATFPGASCSTGWARSTARATLWPTPPTSRNSLGGFDLFVAQIKKRLAAATGLWRID